MLQAKIFKCDGTAICGVPVTVDQMSLAVDVFNRTDHNHLITFGDVPPGRINGLAGAASAKLHIDGQYVIASISIFQTPMGKIAQTLYDNNSLEIYPSAYVTPNPDGLEFRIRSLVFPTYRSRPQPSPLRQMQCWVTETEFWPMFALKEHKY